MRRPAPPPPPERGHDRRTEVAAAVDVDVIDTAVQRAVDETVVSDAADPDSITAVIEDSFAAMDAGVDRERTTSPAAIAARTEPDVSADVPGPHVEEQVGARDLWRAARARRKALRAEIRRFTQRSRRRRIMWVIGLLVVTLVVGGGAIAAYSPLFAVQKITVTGGTTVDPAVVEAALAEQLGTPLALVDASAVKEALVAFPLIETYTLEAHPPHDLLVRIVERTPVGVLAGEAGYTLVDAAGVALATTTTVPVGQPVLEVSGGVGSPAFASAGLVVRSVPLDVRAQLTKVTATSADDVTLTLGSGLVVVWGSAEQSALKAAVLSATMTAHPSATVYDVSSPEAVVVG